MTMNKNNRALIYCRVSSDRQKTEGHGLESQEHLCRGYARQNGYEVEKSFYDSFTGGGDFMNRPAMSKMLDYIDSKPHINFTVIFDDLKRFARDTEFHWKLRNSLKVRNVTPKCLNFNFEDTPEGEFIETILAAQGQLERQQNKRQVIQKQKARLEKGYWSFNPPPGLKHIKDPVHGKLLVWDEPQASIIKEALEGFASGRFSEQVDVQKFLESKNFFYRRKNKYVHFEQVRRILNRPLYAGYVEYLPWEVSMRKGHHKPIISIETFNKIQEKLNSRRRAPTRKDIRKDFPLRGFVLCCECKNRMTSSWSKGRGGRYAYYRCNMKGCGCYGKSIKKDKVEGDFENLLKEVVPKKNLFSLIRVIFLDIWNKRIGGFEDREKNKQKELNNIEKEIQLLVDKAVKAKSERVASVYETQIEDLDKKKESLEQKNNSSKSHKVDFGTALDKVLEFIKNPYKIWSNEGLYDKRLVLKLVFTEDLAYSPENGFGTAKLSPILWLFGGTGDTNSPDVEMARIELAFK